MPIMRRWRGWQAIPSDMRRLLVEAALTLAWTRLLVAFGLRFCTPWMIRPGSNATPVPPLLERRLRYALRIAANTVPWKSVCLPNAVAGKLMLQRRGWQSTIHLGVGFEPSGALHAHAWLEAGGIIITGQEGMAKVVPFKLKQSPAAA